MTTFTYTLANSLAEAGRAAADAETKLIAGGQSLLGAIKLGLAAPEALIDLSGLADLKGIRVDGGHVVIGAMTTHATVAASHEVRRAIPALADLAGRIGDRQVRNRGTLGGSLANNDPAACYPAAVLGLGATIYTDRRSIAADDFFKGLFETALQPGEIISSISFPVPNKAAWQKFKQPASRFSLVGVFVAQTAAGVRVAVTGAAAGVFRFTAMEAALQANWSAASAAQVGISASKLNGDLHGSADYRAALIPVLTGRAVAATQ
ncbi:FAD binding domain-containing protein [Roseateles oligotrophus]|uniref:Xanthine dehydrogenase family protein subunit M n=1 Tax=Roseateles oligotrophus TaxID=1769250 RepID=A0ABT2YD12_9BURK|nr:xanthine dehydrogenase family protein subunit M [Roseateles oligotrophus]MCV2367906.1 xanthine dehydrogenase family protein subunit M [Roseateles oligotrophus]